MQKYWSDNNNHWWLNIKQITYSENYLIMNHFILNGVKFNLKWKKTQIIKNKLFYFK